MSLGVDYYSILDLRRDATPLHILQAYRRLALQWHPSKHPLGPSDSAVQLHFLRISEAYDVLTDPQRRALFDYYGEKGLKAGTTTSTGEVTPPYTLATTPLALFDTVFGTPSPYAAALSYNTTDAPPHREAPTKPAPLLIQMFLSLEELYHGCTKKVKVARKRLTQPSPSSPPASSTSESTPSPPFPSTFILDERVLAVNILPGYPAGTRITFPGEGDEGEGGGGEGGGGVVGDVCMVVVEKPHVRMRRVGDDLVWVCALRLVDALCGVVVCVEMLDGRVLSVGLSEVCEPKGVKRVKGEGMPKVGGGGKGDLLIHYDIAFPEQLTLQQKEQIRHALQQ